MNAVLSTILCLVSIVQLSGASVDGGKGRYGYQVQFGTNENERKEIVDFKGKSRYKT